MIMIMKILAVVLPTSIPCLLFFLPEQYYRMQKNFFEKVTPRSANDEIKLLLMGLIGSFILWCILFCLFSLLERIL
ncbi:hypothetical protein FI615_002219 [Enterococcus faecium]|uniref:hypothetical protein n=1 Tax=Enterococcus faecium TaxID=1352 RepID=UPI0019225F09|nr:hypothetical protein [Enterococcus faecium]EGP4894699.1 hypothetical protein [Enterococcus faecium]EHK9937514.1 hypothetical protein [Enterococcus faecium]EMF0115800.1 hypothetical protein [Enterococcus hirae]MBL3707125.1 hypothetical protein [Enterococcus faecium]